MPVIKSAAKALRQSIKRGLANREVKSRMKSMIDAHKKSQTPDNLAKAFSAIDRAVKNNLVHKNKAARLKSQLSKLAPKAEAIAKTAAKTVTKKATAVSKTVKKTVAKKTAAKTSKK